MRETQDSKESKQYTSQKRGGCEWLVRERAGYVNTTSSCHARRRSLLLHPFPKPTVGALSVPNAGGRIGATDINRPSVCYPGLAIS